MDLLSAIRKVKEQLVKDQKYDLASYIRDYEIDKMRLEETTKVNSEYEADGEFFKCQVFVEDAVIELDDEALMEAIIDSQKESFGEEFREFLDTRKVIVNIK